MDSIDSRRDLINSSKLYNRSRHKDSLEFTLSKIVLSISFVFKEEYIRSISFIFNKIFNSLPLNIYFLRFFTRHHPAYYRYAPSPLLALKAFGHVGHLDPEGRNRYYKWIDSL